MLCLAWRNPPHGCSRAITWVCRLTGTGPTIQPIIATGMVEIGTRFFFQVTEFTHLHEPTTCSSFQGTTMHCTSSDPQDWRVTQSAQWIEWISSTLGLRDISLSKLCIEGRVLCSLPQSELVRIVPSCGDVLFIVLKQISVVYEMHGSDHAKHHSWHTVTRREIS